MKTTIGNYASYIYVKPWDDSFKPLTTKSLASGIYLDYNKDGELVGIEILDEIVPEYYSDYKKKMTDKLLDTEAAIHKMLNDLDNDKETKDVLTKLVPDGIKIK